MTSIKPLLIACLTLASLFIASAMNCRTVSALSDTIGQQLAISQAAAENGQWSEAEDALVQAGELWHSHNTYLHITVNHAEIDEAETLFAQMQEYAQKQDLAQYCTTAEQLTLQLQQLKETQQLSIKNIF